MVLLVTKELNITYFLADIQQMSAELKRMKNIREVYFVENKNATSKSILWNGNSSEARTIILVWRIPAGYNSNLDPHNWSG